MRYTAHLQSGGTVDLTVKDGFSGVTMFGTTVEWIMDDNGAMINMAHVAALVPVIEMDPCGAPTAKRLAMRAAYEKRLAAARLV